MKTKLYSLTYRDDGIYIAVMPDNQRSTIETHFEHLAEAFQNHPADTPMYLLIDASSGDKLPSIRYLVNKLRDFYKTHTAPKKLYIAYIYPRDDVSLVCLFSCFRLCVSTHPGVFSGLKKPQQPGY